MFPTMYIVVSGLMANSQQMDYHLHSTWVSSAIDHSLYNMALTTIWPASQQDMSWSTSSILIWSCLALVFYLVSLAIYRLYLSPLARYPGPRLAGLTYWYEFYYDVYLSGKYIFHIEELHRQYGPVVRVNPGEVHINDPAFYSEIYHNNKWLTDRDRWYNLDHLGEALPFTQLHEVHKRRRDSLAQYFSMQSIRSLEPRIATVADNMMSRFKLAAQTGEVVNVSWMSAAFAMDVVTQYAFGEALGTTDMLLDNMGKWAFDMSKNTLPMNPVSRQFKLLIATMTRLPDSVIVSMNPHVKNYVQWAGQINSWAIKSIREFDGGPSKKSGQQVTVLHELLKSNLPASDKSERRLCDEMNIVIGAGTESSAQTLQRTFFHIVSNPAVLQKLRAELKKAIPNANSKVDLALLQSLPYLTAVIEEGLRVAFPVPSRSPRVFRDHTLHYKQFPIPPGVAVSTSPYVVSANEEIFPEPLKFKPERWLGDKDLQKYAVTFGKGARACLGKK
jgi:cytochrome P450